MPFKNKVRCLDGNLDVVPCGLVVKTYANVIGVPLESVAASVNIINVAAEITLTQNFINNSEETIQTVYFFPSEENVALHSFRAILDGKTLVGVVKDKDTAREDFVEAVKQNKSAFLLEEVKPDIMELFIGNLKAGSKCSIEVKYVQELAVQDYLPRFTLPTTIAPRYIPPSDPNPAVESANYQFQNIPDAPIEIIVNTSMRRSITDITSPSHKIENHMESEVGDDGFYHSKSTLNGKTTSMDKDFVLIIETKDPLKAIIIVEEKQAPGESYAVMTSFVPQFDVDDQLCEMIFLIDCSGSMSGKPVQKAVDALQIFLQSLPEDCYFNIFRFGSSYQSLYEKSQKYTEKSLKKAKMYAKETHANLGGTEVLSPLTHILKLPTIDKYKRQVLFLTDGQVSNTSAVINYVNKERGEGRVFTLGIGQSASRELVKGIARAGDGIASFCTILEPMHEKVANLLNAAIRTDTSITDVKFKCADNEVATRVPIITPMPIFNREQVTIYGILDKIPDEVVLGCAVTGKTVALHFGKENIVKIDNHLIHKLTVRNMIKQNEELSSKPAAEYAQLKELALQEGIVTKFTSIICIAEEELLLQQTTPTALAQNVKKQGEYDDDIDFLTMRSAGVMNYQAQSLGSSSLNYYQGSAKKSAGFSLPFKLPSLGSLFGKKSAPAPAMKSAAPRAAPCDMGMYEDLSIEECASAMPYDLSEDELFQEIMESGSSEEESDDELSRRLAALSELDSPSGGAINANKSDKASGDRKEFREQQLVKLLNLASISGAYSDVSKVGEVLNVDVGGFLTQNNVNKDSTEVWLTCLVVIFLETKCSHMKQSWNLVVKKSRKWLQKSNVSNLKDIEETCKQHIGKC